MKIKRPSQVDLVLGLHHVVSVALDVFLDKLGLSLMHYHLLKHMSENTLALTMSDITRFYNISSAAATGSVDRLEKLGYVTRAFSTEDRRKVLVKVTRKTHDLLEESSQIVSRLFAVDHHFVELLQKLSPEIALPA